MLDKKLNLYDDDLDDYLINTDSIHDLINPNNQYQYGGGFESRNRYKKYSNFINEYNANGGYQKVNNYNNYNDNDDYDLENTDAEFEKIKDIMKQNGGYFSDDNDALSLLDDNSDDDFEKIKNFINDEKDDDFNMDGGSSILSSSSNMDSILNGPSPDTISDDKLFDIKNILNGNSPSPSYDDSIDNNMIQQEQVQEPSSVSSDTNDINKILERNNDNHSSPNFNKSDDISSVDSMDNDYQKNGFDSESSGRDVYVDKQNLSTENVAVSNNDSNNNAYNMNYRTLKRPYYSETETELENKHPYQRNYRYN